MDKKRVLQTAKTTLTWVLVAAAVAIMIFTMISVNTFDRNDRSLFGFKIYVVLSDSMSSVQGDTEKGYFNAGDLVLIREVDPTTLHEGDIIAYISTNAENYGKTVTHMIRRTTTDAKGNSGFITYGTHTNADDANVVTHPYVQGKYAGRIPAVGSFFLFLKTTPGYIICILLPFLLLIGLQGYHSVQLFLRYKKEQLAEIEAVREKDRNEIEQARRDLESERQKQAEMLEQLAALQQAMGISNGMPNGSAQTETGEDAPPPTDSGIHG